MTIRNTDKAAYPTTQNGSAIKTRDLVFGTVKEINNGDAGSMQSAGLRAQLANYMRAYRNNGSYRLVEQASSGQFGPLFGLGNTADAARDWRTTLVQVARMAESATFATRLEIDRQLRYAWDRVEGSAGNPVDALAITAATGGVDIAANVGDIVELSIDDYVGSVIYWNLSGIPGGSRELLDSSGHPYTQSTIKLVITERMLEAGTVTVTPRVGRAWTNPTAPQWEFVEDGAFTITVTEAQAAPEPVTAEEVADYKAIVKVKHTVSKTEINSVNKSVLVEVLNGEKDLDEAIFEAGGNPLT